MKPRCNLVWLKRDLRTRDHLPLHSAEQAGLPYLILFLFEPGLINQPDTSLRHLQFQFQALRAMLPRLQAFGQTIYLCYAGAIDVFGALLEDFEIEQVFSYAETGTQATWNRDRAVKQLLHSNGVRWTEFQRDGIVRGKRSRKGWDEQWQQVMNAPIIQNQFSPAPDWYNPFPIPDTDLAKWTNYPPEFQPAGEGYAWRYLKSFLEERGTRYQRHISKPQESRTACSRLSPYLAWGCLSMRQVYQTTKQTRRSRVFSAFISRLHWHCHFIQKLEAEQRYEYACINQGFEALPYRDNTAQLEAWKTGHTGVPLVDACMRCLHATGWVNFRMRALLVSFLCHLLLIDWRRGVHHLAQLFLDYEPGIHYPQFQMQAGTTGVNTLRIYNPVKNGQKHDPEGAFTRRWLPELATLPDAFLHEPWKMTLMEQQLYGIELGKDYPYPIIDLQQAARQARDLLWAHRKHPEVKQDSRRILAVHVRPKPDIHG